MMFRKNDQFFGEMFGLEGYRDRDFWEKVWYVFSPARAARDGGLAALLQSVISGPVGSPEPEAQADAEGLMLPETGPGGKVSQTGLGVESDTGAKTGIGAGEGTFGPNTVGAAERYVPKNIKMVDEKLLKKNGLDAHQIKDDVVGGNLSKYDIYVDKDTGQLWVWKRRERRRHTHWRIYYQELRRPKWIRRMLWLNSASLATILILKLLRINSIYGLKNIG
jgi:filamentous hemagglutinin